MIMVCYSLLLVVVMMIGWSGEAKSIAMDIVTERRNQR